MNHSRLHRALKWFWFIAGVIGLVDYLWWPKLGIANSIPVLFAISIAANVIAHWAAEEASE